MLNAETDQKTTYLGHQPDSTVLKKFKSGQRSDDYLTTTTPFLDPISRQRDPIHRNEDLLPSGVSLIHVKGHVGDNTAASLTKDISFKSTGDNVRIRARRINGGTMGNEAKVEGNVITLDAIGDKGEIKVKKGGTANIGNAGKHLIVVLHDEDMPNASRIVSIENAPEGKEAPIFIAKSEYNFLHENYRHAHTR
ncbi:MAG: hypothetical protein GY804_12600 [Alphaproteobacteria bacterium]|nr:hypothetical protein [Alphaproteobacteria bacterium]